jgi:long-chain acyl-CoA synthetase
MYFGVHLAGGVISALEESVPTSELLKVARHIGARYVVDSELTDQQDVQVLPRTVMASAGEYAAPKQLAFPDGKDLADILFTTGTTGASKGVALTHDTLCATEENLRVGCGYRESTVMVAPSPLNHAHAIPICIRRLPAAARFICSTG